MLLIDIVLAINKNDMIGNVMRLLSEKRRRFIADWMLNFSASMGPLIVLQLVVLPRLALRVDAEANGLALSMIALMSLVPSTLGNSLNNVRLLDTDGNDEGSYRFLLILSVLVGFITVTILAIAYAGSVSLSSILTGITACFMLVQEYLVVEYRILIDFRKIALNGLFISMGYIVGYVLFTVTEEWSVVYLTGQFTSFVYVLFTTKLWRGSIKRGLTFKSVFSDYGMLLCSGLLNRAISYADRLVLYPLMGGYSVSVYYASTLLGKMLSTVVTPMSGVMLSYLTKVEIKPKHLFRSMIIGSLIISVVAYFVTIAVSGWILKALYPEYVDKAMSLIWITTAASYCAVLVSIVNPFVLKYSELRNQTIVSGGTLFLYIVASVISVKYYGLIGFCFASLIVSFLKLLTLILIFEKSPTQYNHN